MNDVLKKLHQLARAHDAGAMDIAAMNNHVHDVLRELDPGELAELVGKLLFLCEDLKPGVST